MKKNILIYIAEKGLAPKGGPKAVCYFYNEEQKRRGEKIFSFISDVETHHALHQKEDALKDKLPGWFFSLYEYVKEYVKYIKFLYLKPNGSVEDLSKYDLIHFHDVRSLYSAREDLKSYKGKVLLQSHTPVPSGFEIYDSLKPTTKYLIPFIRKRFEMMDRYAFTRADYIIFPCEDAEEPYYNNWKYYKKFHKIKPEAYKYVLTGINACVPKRTRTEVRKELNLSEKDFLISYMGRHNQVKGYDLLKQYAEKFLARHEDSWVVVGGKESPITRLEHPRWMELGWTTDAHSYISASDVFVLPNRETYFDIVMLEILSLGKIVIASRTGGNKYFEKNGCQGVLLYDNEEECLTLLNKVYNMSLAERNELGQKNKDFFDAHCTVSCMYDSYMALLENL